MSSASLAGKTAIVTGSGQNIGRGIALKLAEQGANIVVNGRRDRAKIDKVVGEIEEAGGRALGILADVGDPDAVERMVAQAAAHFGSVDIAISNVAVRKHQPFSEISPADWNAILNSNLSSAFYLARAVVPWMQKQGWGRILHISGRDGFFVKANRAHNVVAKAGVHALAKAIALEMGPYGITANTIAPGLIETRRDMAQYPDYDHMMNERVPAIPVRRIGTVDDLASLCAFLASTEAGYITGQLIHANGGEFMY